MIFFLPSSTMFHHSLTILHRWFTVACMQRSDRSRWTPGAHLLVHGDEAIKGCPGTQHVVDAWGADEGTSRGSPMPCLC